MRVTDLPNHLYLKFFGTFLNWTINNKSHEIMLANHFYKICNNIPKAIPNDITLDKICILYKNLKKSTTKNDVSNLGSI